VCDGERDLQRAVAGLGAAVGEEHSVQSRRRDRGQALGQLERARMPYLEVRREIERVDLPLHRLGDARVAMPRTDAPQARGAVEHLATIGRAIGNALRSAHQPGRDLELPVRRERHPVGVECRRHFAVYPPSTISVWPVM
jgi:hypothetical protein